MNTIKTLLLTLVGMLSMTIPVAASGLEYTRPALAAKPVYQDCVLSMAAGEILEFSPEDLERRLGFDPDTLSGLTVTALPTAQSGILVLEGVEVSPYQFLSREELGELCFVPAEQAATAELTFAPQGVDASPVSISIHVLAEKNHAPELAGESYVTLANTSVSGVLSPLDPDGDAVILKLSRKPQKGEVSLTNHSFTYTPYKDATGSDSFAVVAVDRFQNYSQEAVVEIKLERNQSGFSYQDMSVHPSAYAAVMLHEKGVLSGEKIGSAWFFSPDRQVTRGEFLHYLLAATGLDEGRTPTVNTGLPNDTDLPMWRKSYLKRAVEQGIWEPDLPFYYSEILTRAEAVVLTHRASGIADVKEYALAFADAADIPQWALPSYRDLAAYKMLDLHDGKARPTLPLDRGAAADLLWQLWKHHNR